MSDRLHPQAEHHFLAIRAELCRATRSLTQDDFEALMHDLNEAVSDLTWEVLQLNAQPALSLARVWPATTPALDPLDCAP